MRPVTFESRATFKILTLGVIVGVPAAYLVDQGNSYTLRTPPDPDKALLYLLFGLPCLVVAFIFLARAFSHKKIILSTAQVEIRVGGRGHKIRWESIQSITYSPYVGFGSICVRADRRTFRFTRFDFPNLTSLYEALQEGMRRDSDQD